MNKKNLKTKNKNESAEDNELVTKGFLKSYLVEQDYVTKDFLKVQLVEFKKDFREEINNDFERYIGAIMEDNQHKHDQLIESFNMQYELFARYTDGNEIDKTKINSRLDRLESKVLLA